SRNFAGQPPGALAPGQAVSGAGPSTVSAGPATGGVGALSPLAPVAPPATSPGSGVQWVIGQGYLGQFEQPDANVTTETGQVASTTHMVELDSTLSLGPPLKLSGEIDGSVEKSSNEALAPSLEGAAYHLEAETFRGPFHLSGKISGTSPNFTSIGNLLTSGDTLN